MDLSSAVTQLLGVLDETRNGRPGNLPDGWTYYSFPDFGLEQAVAGLSPKQAARVVGNNSVAQQVRHITFANGVFTGWLRGETDGATDWPSSWVVGEVNSAEWQRLKDGLWASIAGLRAAIETHALESERRLTQAHGAVAHLVYHHSAIRAKLPQLQESL